MFEYNTMRTNKLYQKKKSHYKSHYSEMTKAKFAEVDTDLHTTIPNNLVKFEHNNS
jgi:hypothetical protein